MTPMALSKFKTPQCAAPDSAFGAVDRGPTDPVSIRIQQSIASGIPVVLGLRTRT